LNIVYVILYIIMIYSSRNKSDFSDWSHFTRG